MKRFFSITNRDFNILDLVSLILAFSFLYNKNIEMFFLTFYLLIWSRNSYFSFKDYKSTGKLTFKIFVDIFIFLGSSILVIFMIYSYLFKF